MKKIKKPRKKFTTNAWVVLFKHEDGWTISAVEFRQDSAIAEMKSQMKICPGFRYRIAPAKIFVSQHYINIK